jgi:hypothetical protein
VCWWSPSPRYCIPPCRSTVLYELVTGHPDRTAFQLVFGADLTCELRAWSYGAWATLGVDPQTAAGAVIATWQDSHV